MLFFSLIALLLAPTSQPAPQPALLPDSSARTLADRLGALDVLTIHYAHQNGSDLEKWDVIITSRDLLSKFEAMRKSEWHGEVLYLRSYPVAAKIDTTRYTGFVGNIKYSGHPLALRLKPPNQPWELYVATDDAAATLTKLIETEAQKQRPKNPVIEKR